MPIYENAEEFKAGGGRLIHSAEHLDPSIVVGKKVVVIGCGKSAHDIVLHSSKGGATSSTLLYRTAHWGLPRLLFGFIPFHLIFCSRLGQLLVSIHKGAFPGAPWYVGCLHWCLSRPIRLLFWIIEQVVALQLNQYGDYRPKDDAVFDLYGGHGMILSPEFKNARKEGRLSAVHGQIVRLIKGGAVVKTPRKASTCWGSSDPAAYKVLAEEYTIPCDVIICATGFSKSYDYLPAKEQKDLGVERDGLYLYRHIFPTGVAKLAFCGETQTIINILTHALQSEYIARVVAGAMALPPKVEMDETIAEMKQVCCVPYNAR